MCTQLINKPSVTESAFITRDSVAPQSGVKPRTESSRQGLKTLPLLAQFLALHGKPKTRRW